MPLHVRAISMRIAVICLFIISFVGWFSGLEPLVCCERALIGAVAVYVFVTIMVQAINHILINALVKSRMEAQEREMNGHGN